jgi:hypothetical protein
MPELRFVRIGNSCGPTQKLHIMCAALITNSDLVTIRSAGPEIASQYNMIRRLTRSDTARNTPLHSRPLNSDELPCVNGLTMT